MPTGQAERQHGSLQPVSNDRRQGAVVDHPCSVPIEGEAHAEVHARLHQALPGVQP